MIWRQYPPVIMRGLFFILFYDLSMNFFPCVFSMLSHVIFPCVIPLFSYLSPLRCAVELRRPDSSGCQCRLSLWVRPCRSRTSPAAHSSCSRQSSVGGQKRESSKTASVWTKSNMILQECKTCCINKNNNPHTNDVKCMVHSTALHKYVMNNSLRLSD